MRKVDQDLKSLLDNLVALLSPNAGHEAHTASIMFLLWMVESLRCRYAATAIRCMHGDLLDGLAMCAMCSPA
jgi:hypothetical protein